MHSVVAPRQVCVISPHLDDAVFGCGRFLASHPGCTVLTVFAGPAPSDGVTAYDARCGFASSAQAMAARLAEDDCALAMLESHALRMNERDSQYAALPDPGFLADRLAQALVCPRGRSLSGSEASPRMGEASLLAPSFEASTHAQ